MCELLHYFLCTTKNTLENGTGQILSLCNWPLWTSFPRAKPIHNKSVPGFIVACPALIRHFFLNSTSWLFTHCGYFYPLSPKTALSENQGPGVFLGISCMPELRPNWTSGARTAPSPLWKIPCWKLMTQFFHPLDLCIIRNPNLLPRFQDLVSSQSIKRVP